MLLTPRPLSIRHLAGNASLLAHAARPATVPTSIRRRPNAPLASALAPAVFLNGHGKLFSASSPRTYSTPSASAASGPSRPRRALLYVPGSDERKIKKSLESTADCLIYDLEDSVAPHRKGAARETVLNALNATKTGPELAVRINPPSSSASLASDDLDIVLLSNRLQTIVIPKVESAEDVLFVRDRIAQARSSRDGDSPISVILSIESASSLLQIPHIIRSASHHPTAPSAKLSALLFASEDFCAQTGIVRTESRRELLYARSRIVAVAKAFGLQAIDMASLLVCINYKDASYLQDECTDGRQLGFDGKQAIHPSQVEIIQRAFSPSQEEVERAARILAQYETSLRTHKGAYGFEEKDGKGTTMIDAPMVLQAQAIIDKARLAGMEVPGIDVEPSSEGDKKEGRL